MNVISAYTTFLNNEIEALTITSAPTKLYDPIHYFMSIGGKRMRPMLTLLAGEMFGLTKESVLNAALAVELFHNFSLVHDDIMDQAPFRRTHQTVHEKWNSSVAILTGDVLMIQAYEQLCKQHARHVPALMYIFNQTAIEVCEGQQMDMDFETQQTVELATYLEMIRLKTSVLVGCALEMGAIIADQSESNRKELYEFGINIGLAFQLQDDYLDLYGETAKFGKQIGGDILANKKTILSIKAFERANETQRAALIALQDEKNPTTKIAASKALFETLAIPAFTQEMILNYHQKGIENLSNIDLPAEKKEDLLAIARFLLHRDV